MDTQSPTYSDDELTAALAEHLASLDRDDSYRVERVLKRSSVEATELVYFEGTGGGSLGPFVRKRIDASAQIGGAYERLFAAQRAGRRFEHLPRIVDCRRAGEELDVVMEYVEGETLEALMGRLGATPDYARELYPVLCEAVGELHAGFAAAGEPGVPVIHRDLKPSNIIVSGVRYAADAGMTFSSLVIIDLGIARVWRDGADADTVKFGTRPYAPPEQYGFGQTSVRSDVYALGALLFFCLTGVDPKPGLDMREQCEARGIPTPLSDAVCMSMALDPAKRFASAEALGRATRAAYDLSRPVRPPAPVRTPASETVLTPQGLKNPTGHPGPAASAACGLLSRVPESLGRIWNTLVCFSLLVFFVGSHFAVFHPTGANQSYPTWLLIIEYFFFVDGLMVLMHFALFDKRRLRRRFALLDSYRGKKLAKLWLKALGVLLLCMIVIVAVANATGVVDTSAT
ncbi:serine/threonine protein kinase [Collinsella aerofaciens]|uniref:serine/threonine protein kinase n=1 Tax=Collinsella aerofaciens TaxID=74426 RepID=UPI0022E82D7C|nr:protein kinase [Collinsella aerofaciens]